MVRSQPVMKRALRGCPGPLGPEDAAGSFLLTSCGAPETTGQRVLRPKCHVTKSVFQGASRVGTAGRTEQTRGLGERSDGVSGQ